MAKPSHSTLLASWQRFSARNVRVTINAPGDISISYLDGCNGEPRGTHTLTLARVEVLAMGWVAWTLVHEDGTEETRKGAIHPDFNAGASARKHAAELARRELVRDAHPRHVEVEWRVYQTALRYRELMITRGTHTITAPKRRADRGIPALK